MQAGRQAQEYNILGMIQGRDGGDKESGTVQIAAWTIIDGRQNVQRYLIYYLLECYITAN